MIDLQSPDVAKALTEYFGITGAGRTPMALDQVVVPTINVGDIAASLRAGPQAVMSGTDLPAVAANFGAYTLRNITPVNTPPRRIFVEAVHLYVQTTALWRWSLTATLPTTFVLPPQVRDSQLATSTQPHGSLYAQNVAVNIPAGSAGFVNLVSGNVPFQLTIPESGLIINPGGRLDICCVTANLLSSCAIFWREEEL